MPAARFVEQLNIQIGNELAAHNQYLACAVYYDAQTMPQMATFFYNQALEERAHAMMMVRYLLDTDAEVLIPGVEAPTPKFGDVVEPVALALEQERRVTEQVNTLIRVTSTNGVQGDGDSFSPALSMDGRFVALDSKAASLDTSGGSVGGQDVFVHVNF